MKKNYLNLHIVYKYLVEGKISQNILKDLRLAQDIKKYLKESFYMNTIVHMFCL